MGLAMPMGDQPLHKRIAGRPVNGGFASSINIGDGHHIRLIKTGAKILEQSMQPRVAVRLVNGNHAPRACLPGRFKHCGNFHRMVAIIIDDFDPIHHRHPCEAAFDALEIRQRRADLPPRDPQMPRHSDRRQRIGHIMTPRHGQAALF